MKKITIFLFCLIFFTVKGFSQCPNADFSMGDFSYWSGSTGMNSGGDYSSIVNGIVQGITNSGPFDNGQQTIINAPGTDPNTGNALSVLPPGGSSCARLGNGNYNYHAERLSYTLAVTSSNCIFTYQYAVVLEDPGHSTVEQPKFTIYVKNSAGNVIDPVCGIYEVSAQGGIPGFQDSYAADDGEQVRWKNWTTVGIDLSSYIGQNITIEFTTYDCAQGGHFGYAYIACSCGSLQPTQQCLGTSSIVTAPPGFSTYSWSTGQTTQSVTYNFPPYVNGTVVSVVCTSVQGCSVTLQTTLSVDPPVFTVNTPAPICAGESATVTVTGTESYTWSSPPGGTGNSITVTPGTTTTYTVTATTAGGCSDIETVTVTVNALPVASAGNDVTICPGENATLDASGSTGTGLSYNWSGGLGTTPQVTVSPSSNTTYTVTVTSNGCTASDNVVVTIVNNLSVTATPATSSICSGSNVVLTAAGAANYIWSPATGLSSTSGSSVTASPTSNITYTVTGTTGGCSGTASVIVNVNSVSISATPANPTICSGGNVVLTASGTGLTNYLWSPATGLSTTSGASVTASPTTDITYTVTGTDAIGCSATTSVTVNVITISATATATDENCGHANGTATVAPSGNCTLSWGYVWNTNPVQNSQTANNLPAGSYTVTVNCGACSTATSVSVNNLPGPSVAITSITNTTCSDPNGSASAQATGGSGTYIYSWSNGQSGTNLSGVMAGTYQILVTDQDNCTATNTVTIIDAPGPMATIVNIVPEDCGFTNGQLTANITGGTPNFLYAWSTNPQQTSSTATGLSAGTYTVTVTDGNSCTATAFATVPLINGPTASALSTPEYCDQSNGTVTVTATGGSGIYSFTWSSNPPQYTQTATNLPAGSYTVVVDDGGCTTATTVNIMEIQGPDAGFSANPKVLTIMDGPVSFLDNSSGNIVDWNWNLGDGSMGTGTEFDHPYENIGTYVVTLIVTDNNGCLDTTVDTIKVKDIFTFYIPNAFTPNNDGYNDFFFPQGVSVDPNNFDMYIFDRWGNLMFHTSLWFENHSALWNGTMHNAGTYEDVVMDVYVYRIKVKEMEGPKHEYIGRIALIP
ncbi:MAG: PKD domain-containing protein [Bacteroidota bacterium]